MNIVKEFCCILICRKISRFNFIMYFDVCKEESHFDYFAVHQFFSEISYFHFTCFVHILALKKREIFW